MGLFDFFKRYDHQAVIEQARLNKKIIQQADDVVALCSTLERRLTRFFEAVGNGQGRGTSPREQAVSAAQRAQGWSVERNPRVFFKRGEAFTSPAKQYITVAILAQQLSETINHLAGKHPQEPLDRKRPLSENITNRAELLRTTLYRSLSELKHHLAGACAQHFKEGELDTLFRQFFEAFDKDFAAVAALAESLQKLEKK